LYRDAHYRTKVEYYTAFARRWGVPEGVGRLTEEEARHRSWSWKFTLRGRRVEKMELVNGSGDPTTWHGELAFLHRPEEKVRECCFEYRRDDLGEVLEEVARPERAGSVDVPLQHAHDRLPRPGG
jgi:hypothetical protein